MTIRMDNTCIYVYVKYKKYRYYGTSKVSIKHCLKYIKESLFDDDEYQFVKNRIKTKYLNND